MLQSVNNLWTNSVKTEKKVKKGLKTDRESTSVKKPTIYSNYEKYSTGDRRKNNFEDKSNYASRLYSPNNSQIYKYQIKFDNEIKRTQNQTQPSSLKSKYVSNYKYNYNTFNKNNNSSKFYGIRW